MTLSAFDHLALGVASTDSVTSTTQVRKIRHVERQRTTLAGFVAALGEIAMDGVEVESVRLR